MKVFSLGAGMLVALAGCSSGASDNGPDTTNGQGYGGLPFQPGSGGFGNPSGAFPGAGGSMFPGGGGYVNPGGGGYVNPGAGGYVNPGAGGVVNPGAGGVVNPGAGGVVNPGAGGVVNPGSGGSVNPGSGGSAGGATLAHCDQTTETSAAPITQACGDITDPTGTNVPLGPYGAMMDVNVGKGFENPNPNDDATCPGFANLFKESAQMTTQLLDTGPQPCTLSTPNTGNCLNYQLYSVYRPANWPAGPIPVLTWGNGTCAQPEGYGTLLRYIASYGFFVVAANSREVGSGTQLTKALDFVAAANKDSTSPYYGHVDMTKVGVMGHSQGAQGAAAAAADSRIQYVILFNGVGAGTPTKPTLFVTGDLDIVATTPQALTTTINGLQKGAFLYYHNPAGNSADTLRGHLVLMLTPERVAPAATAWWQLLFFNDANARNMYVGSTCGLCGHSSDYDFGEHGL